MCELSRQQHMSMLLPSSSPAMSAVTASELPPSSAFPMLDCDGPPSYVASERFDDVAAGEPLSASSSAILAPSHQMQQQNHLSSQHPQLSSGAPIVMTSASPLSASMVG